MSRSSPKRALLLVFALAWLVPCLRAETKLADNVTINSGAENAFWELALLFLAAPYGIAHDLEHVGLPRFPYEHNEGYASGSREVSLALNGSTQSVGQGRTAQHYLLRMRTEGRLGGDFSSAVFEPGALAEARSTYHSVHFSGNYRQSRWFLVDAGMGLAALHDPTDHWGYSMQASVEVFPMKPLNGSLSYRIGWPAGRPSHDISVLLGASWHRVGIGAGGRFFLTPGKDLIGPEVGLRAWF